MEKKQRGRPKQERPREAISTRLPGDLADKLREEAERQDRTVSQMLVLIVKEWAGRTK